LKPNKCKLQIGWKKDCLEMQKQSREIVLHGMNMLNEKLGEKSWIIQPIKDKNSRQRYKVAWHS
jgi:hypothetical protein